jgi:dTDP-4-amino-4,6-dideoxygalactose transaminase
MTRIPFNKPRLAGDELRYIRDAITRGQLAGDGYYTKLCSDILERATCSRRVLLTHSCTAALEMAAILADVGPGDEVIMPSFTFVSTANAFALRGATPVFVDIEPDSLNVCPDAVRRAVTDATKAIVPVHYAGWAADMAPIVETARGCGALVIEDAAQALGSTYEGRPCGSLGDLAAFSFHETKNIISGEGGALAINRPDLVERAEIIREKGTNRSRFFRGQVDKYTWVDIGSSYLPGELIASFLAAQLERTEEINGQRLEACALYRDGLREFEASGRIQLPKEQAARTGNGHMFYLLCRDLDDRTALIEHLRDADITAPFHYVPLHDSPAGARFGRVAGTMDVTDSISQRLVRLPMFPGVQHSLQLVVEACREYFAR